MVFEQGKTSRKAFIGTDYDDAKRRQIANEMNPLTGRNGNSITAEEVTGLLGTNPQQYKDLRRMPGASTLSFYAVGLCEGCTRDFPGHLSHSEHPDTPYFARRSGGGLCGIGACTQAYNPADERDENEPRRRTAFTREKFQLEDDNGILAIDWHRVKVERWPSGVEDNHKQETEDYLRNNVDELRGGSKYLEFDNPLLNSRRIGIDWQTNVDDYSIRLERFGNTMRYFFGEFKRINNTQSRGKMIERKPSGLRNEKEITIGTGESALIWIPSLTDHDDDPADNWHDRVHQDVRNWIDEFEDKWNNYCSIKYCSIKPFVHGDYPGVFIAIYATTNLGSMRALLSSTKYNINNLRSLIDEHHHRQPFIEFREETKELKFFWPNSQTSPYSLKSDDGSLVRIQSVNGQVDILIMVNSLNESEDSGGWTIGLREPDGKPHPLGSRGKPDHFGNIWVSLKFRRTGEHLFVVKQGSVTRYVWIDVPDVPNGNQLRVHLDDGKEWSQLSETGWICSPGSQSKQDIINSNEDEILGGLDFDKQPYQGLAPNECHIGLVQDIGRSVFQQFNDQGPPASISPSVFSRKIREICYLLHMTMWPDEEVEFTIPSLGLMMRRMAEFEYSPRDDENTSWRWSNREICAQSIPDFEEWCVLYDHRSDAMVKDEYGPDSISVDLKTGIRFIKKEGVDNSGIAVIQNRPDLDRIAPSSGEWLVKIWEGAGGDSIDLPAGIDEQVIFRWSGADDSSPRVMSRTSIKRVVNEYKWHDELKIDGNSWVRKKQFSSAAAVEIPSGKLFLQLTVNKKGRDENGDRGWRLHLGHYSIESGEPRERGILIATENSHSDTTRIGWISQLGIVGQGGNQLDLGFLKYPWSSDYLDKAYLIRETCRAFVTLSGAKLGNNPYQIGMPGFIIVYQNQHQGFQYKYPQTIVGALESRFSLGNSKSEVVISKMKKNLLVRLWW